MNNLSKFVTLIVVIFTLSMPATSKAQEDSGDVLYLNSNNSLVLPYFDTSSIVNSNIDAITLSLYVISRTPEEPTELQITINPIDLNSNVVRDGTSYFVDAKKNDYINFRLPKELFEKSLQSSTRFLVRLVNQNQEIVLSGPIGATYDPKLVVETKNGELPDSPKIIENNYYTITNSQLHFGNGDNLAGDKINSIESTNQDIPLWLKWLVAIAALLSLGLAIHQQKIPIKQFHFVNGDNVEGDKIVQEKLFSEKQSIKVLPPSFGGTDHLNLDNVATLRLHVPYSSSSVTLLLDVVSTALDAPLSEGIQVEGMHIYNHSTGIEYIFDKIQNKRQEISVAGRNFTVTLLEIVLLNTQSVSGAIEYKFGISEH